MPARRLHPASQDLVTLDGQGEDGFVGRLSSGWLGSHPPGRFPMSPRQKVAANDILCHPFREGCTFVEAFQQKTFLSIRVFASSFGLRESTSIAHGPFRGHTR